MNRQQQIALLQVINDNYHLLSNLLVGIYALGSSSERLKKRGKEGLARIIVLEEKLLPQIALLEKELNLKSGAEQNFQRLFAAAKVKNPEVTAIADNLLVCLVDFVTACENKLRVKIKTTPKAA